MQSIHHDIPAIWARIERVLQKHAPDTARTLAGPATELEIDELQVATNLHLPEDFRQSLKVHNGQDDPTRCHSFVIEGLLANIKQIAETWRMLTDLDEGFRRQEPGWNSHSHGEWWNRNWLPFTIGEGDCLCMNLNPVGPGGTFGEILCHVHDSSHEPGVATSYGAWLEAIAAKLETGRFSIDKYGYLQPDIE